MITTLRRYYLSELRLAARSAEDAAEAMWRALHTDATPATSLPLDTPGRAQLVAAEYSCIEDVTGARADELEGLGLTPTQAAAVAALYPAL